MLRRLAPADGSETCQAGVDRALAPSDRLGMFASFMIVCMQALNAWSDGSHTDLEVGGGSEFGDTLGNEAPQAEQAAPGPAEQAVPGQGATWKPNTPKKGTAAHWRFMREEPILQGHHLSIKKLCYMLADWKQEGRVTDHAFNLTLQFVSKGCLQGRGGQHVPLLVPHCPGGPGCPACHLLC